MYHKHYQQEYKLFLSQQVFTRFLILFAQNQCLKVTKTGLLAILCLAVCMNNIANKASVKLQALVYDILLSTTAIFSYAIGSRKLSANKQFFFVGAQTVVSFLQTTQIKQGMSFIATNKVYTSTNKITIV